LSSASVKQLRKATNSFLMSVRPSRLLSICPDGQNTSTCLESYKINRHVK